MGATARSAADPTITLKKISGAIFVRTPDATTFSSLSGARRVPVGTEVEASNGKVSLTASSGQQGVFYEGRFVILVSQPGVIVLQLSGSSFKNCRNARTLASAEKPRPPRRRLWGRAKGKFRTRGRYSITSVRGTTWLTADSCDGTVARVTGGTVGVTDLLRGRQVVVRTGKSYLSKAPVEYAVPAENAGATSIIAGSDGNLWFTETAAGNIGRTTPSGNIIEFPVPGDQPDEETTSSPEVIVAGPDRNLWFTDPGTQSVDRISTDGKITTFQVSGAPHGLTVGPDRSLWFAEDNSMLGRLTTAGVLSEFELPLEFPDDGARITTGADGNLWLVEGSANKIGRVTTAGELTEFDIPTEDSSPAGITLGPDGNVWFTELTGGKVGKITTAGTITEFSLPGGEEAGPDQITIGPDKNLWFTESTASRIGRITPSGQVIEVPTPTEQASPSGITTGPRSTIWFTENETNSLGCARC
jgi:streptogramin lyase